MKTMYKWIVLQDGKIVNYGVLDEPVDISVEKIFPKANSTADRYIEDLQEYADTYLSEYKSEYHYVFRYATIKIDFSDLMET